ncbi:MAG: plasmid pRiA4b ORF-3 family protein [Pseudomonadota bacterium]
MVAQLLIELNNIEPRIWRRLAVPSNITLDELHCVIQGAFAWEDRHLHRFIIDDQIYENCEDYETDELEDINDEREVSLSTLVKQNEHFFYIYDFGDDWRHRITVEKLEFGKHDPFNPVIPHCIGGARACPPEDCGGPWSYPDFIASLFDETHADYEENKAWALGFEPEIFSVPQASALIAASYVWQMERKGKSLSPFDF